MGRPVSTALMKRPCTALMCQYRRRYKRRIYRCEDCGLYRCVCGEPNVLSIGESVAQTRTDRLRARMIEEIERVIEDCAEQMRLRVVTEDE